MKYVLCVCLYSCYTLDFRDAGRGGVCVVSSTSLKMDVCSCTLQVSVPQTISASCYIRDCSSSNPKTIPFLYRKHEQSFNKVTMKKWRMKGSACSPRMCVRLPFHRPSKRVILYAHGNGEDLGNTHRFVRMLRDHLQCHVMAAEYPGAL